MLTREMAEARVLTGARMLDEHGSMRHRMLAYSEDWADDIDLEFFRLSSERRCVIAQVTGTDFHEGRNNLGLTTSQCFAGGFDIYESDTQDATAGDAWQILEDAWRAYLECRQAANRVAESAA